MRITAVAALCVAPLALAGTLDMDLRSREFLIPRNDFVLGSSEKSSSSESQNSNKKSNSNSQSNNNNQITGITTTSTTEVIIIWVNPGNNAATTTVNPAAAAFTAAAVAAATHTVVVGGTTKVYTPDTLEAAVGDVVIFEFHEQNHTATQSAFTAPCVAIAGMDTGFMPNPNGTVNPPPQVAMTVNVTTPIWFYCRQTGHCGAGMTFSINPTANKTQAAFQAAAIAQNGTGTTAPIAAPPAVSSAVSVAPPAATAAASAASAPPATGSSSASTLTSGTGTTNTDGSCSCAVVCAPGSIPNIAVQGVAAFGGMGGSVPASALEVTA